MVPGRQLVDQGFGVARRTSRQAFRIGRRVASDAAGMVQRVRHIAPGPKPGMDDVTLARKVETHIFRGRDAPKGSVDVNVVEGVVELRGEVKNPELKEELERKTRSIPEVRGVENLLHLPKTPAPTRADSPGRQRRTTSRRRAAPRREPRRLNAEKQAPGAEPTPEELAERSEGRPPAPLGGGDQGASGPEV